MARRGFARVGAVAFISLAGCGGCEDDVVPGGVPIVRRIESEADLIPGRESTGRIGDYLLQNDRVRFVVEEAASSTGWGIYGGGLIDVGGPAGAPTDDRLQQLFVQCDFRAFHPTSVEIVSDGRDGGPGVLRFVGEDAGIPVLDTIVDSKPLSVQLTVDYVLEPGRDSVEIVIRAKDLMKTVSREISCGLVMLRGDQSQIFVDGLGDQESRAGGDQPYLISSAWDSPTSWALYRIGAPVTVILAQAEVVPIGPPSVPFLANATVEERYRVGVGARGDVESALEIVRRDRQEPIGGRIVELTLLKSEGLTVPLGRATLTITSSAARPRVFTSVKPDPSDRATFEVPPGRYLVQLDLEGRLVDRFQIVVEAGDVPQVLEHRVGGVGVVQVRSREVDLLGVELGPTPVRVFLISGHDQPILGPLAHQAYLEADEAFFMAAGEYTLFASRGPAHELYSENITVSADAKVMIEPRLIRSVDLGPWVTADLHLHSTKSVDSTVSRRLRVLGTVAEGLDVLIGTEHDAVIDYGPTVNALGLDGAIRSVTGCEISPLYGHMNAWPLPLPSGRETYWSIHWAEYEANHFVRMINPDEIATLAHGAGAQIVQLNHPRMGKGVFDFIGLDPVTAETTLPWPDAQTVELLNSDGLTDYEAVQADLFGLWAHGRRLVAVGVSDAHTTFEGPGYARTMIKGPGGAVSGIDLGAVWTNLAEGRAAAVLGPYAWLTARQGNESAEMGDTLSASGPIELEVKIAAARHISVERFTIFQNGVPLVQRELTADDADPSNPAIRFLGTVTATPTVDAHYVLEVRGGSNRPFANRSLAFTNPVYVDTDGDGFRPGG